MKSRSLAHYQKFHKPTIKVIAHTLLKSKSIQYYISHFNEEKYVYDLIKTKTKLMCIKTKTKLMCIARSLLQHYHLKRGKCSY